METKLFRLDAEITKIITENTTCPFMYKYMKAIVKVDYEDEKELDIEKIKTEISDFLKFILYDKDNSLMVEFPIFDELRVDVYSYIEYFKQLIYYDKDINSWVMRKFAKPNYNIINAICKKTLKVVITGTSTARGETHYMNKFLQDDNREKIINNMKRLLFINDIELIYDSYEHALDLLRLYYHDDKINNNINYAFILPEDTKLSYIDECMEYTGPVNTWVNVFMISDSKLYEVQREIGKISFKKVNLI